MINADSDGVAVVSGVDGVDGDVKETRLKPPAILGINPIYSLVLMVISGAYGLMFTYQQEIGHCQWIMCGIEDLICVMLVLACIVLIADNGIVERGYTWAVSLFIVALMVVSANIYLLVSGGHSVQILLATELTCLSFFALAVISLLVSIIQFIRASS